MCGRYTLTTEADDLLDVFHVPEIPFEHRPRYNIAPTQLVPAVVRDHASRRMGLLRWGLVPPWADDPSIGNRLINARSETAARKPAFRESFRKRRCLLVADGFYEWRKDGEGGGGKTPFWIHLPDRRPFAMAGLWERWQPPGGEALFTCTILTRNADERIRDVHTRMPVILDPGAGEEWLDPDRAVADLDEILGRTFPGPLELHPVSTLVNSPRNERPECIEPITAG